MLDYTRAAIKKLLSDLKTFGFVYDLIAQSLYILFLIYAIFAPMGNLVANIVLLALSIGYFVFYLVNRARKTREAKRLNTEVKRYYRWSKLFVRAFTLGVLIYGVVITADNVTVLSVVLAALMAVGWLLQVLFELLILFVEAEAKLLVAGIEADIEGALKPVQAVTGFVKRITGKEASAPKEPDKRRLWLDERVAEERAEREKRRAERKSVFRSIFKRKRSGGRVEEPVVSPEAAEPADSGESSSPAMLTAGEKKE